MAEKPRNKSSVQRLLQYLEEDLGQKPLHIQSALPSTGGYPSVLGLAASTWERARIVTVAPFAPDLPPDDTTNGIILFEASQARFHPVFVGGIGAETVDLTVWHRAHNYSDPATCSHWTRGQSYTGVRHLEEVLDPGLWHGEIYFQITNVNPGATTTMILFVQGVQDMTVGANVNVVVPPIHVEIDALTTVPPDNVLIVGTTDGTAPGTKSVVRVHGDGVLWKDRDNWDDSVAVDLTTARAAPGVEVRDAIGHPLSGRSLTVLSCTGTAVIKLNYNSTILTTLNSTLYGTIAIDTVNRRFTRTVGTWADDTGGTKVNGYPRNYSAPGTMVTITGTDHNDGTYTVASVSGGGTELNVVEALVAPDEPASALITVDGVRPKTGILITPMLWPATVEVEEEFSRVFVENTAQPGLAMTLLVGDRV